MSKKRRKMTEIDLKEMLEAGVHFGHKKDRWNPKMRPFIYTERNGVHIFDLEKTKEYLEKAMKAAGDITANGGTILFVGTKNQVKAIVREAAKSAGMPYLTDRWPGGMLTNFNTILGRLKYLKDTEEKLDSSEENKTTAGLTKKERLNLKRELEKLNLLFEGVKEMRRIPDAVIVADIVKERIAVREAKKVGIPVIGIADTNANPNIEYPIPANDDAVRAVKYIVDRLAMAITANKKTEEPVMQPEELAAGEDETEEEVEDQKLEKLEMEAEEEVVVKKSKPKEEGNEQEA